LTPSGSGELGTPRFTEGPPERRFRVGVANGLTGTVARAKRIVIPEASAKDLGEDPAKLR
jgi:hypothetical protein